VDASANQNASNADAADASVCAQGERVGDYALAMVIDDANV
jgi:hypothetical protein